MFISGQHICTNHICTWRGDKQRTSQYPIYTEIVPKSSLDHDSGEKNIGGCQSFFQTCSTLFVFTSVTHSSPILTASLAILVPKRSQFSEISKSQKSERDTISGLTRPHDLTRLCLRLCVGAKLRAASAAPVAYHATRASPVMTTYRMAMLRAFERCEDQVKTKTRLSASIYNKVVNCGIAVPQDQSAVVPR